MKPQCAKLVLTLYNDLHKTQEVSYSVFTIANDQSFCMSSWCFRCLFGLSGQHSGSQLWGVPGELLPASRRGVRGCLSALFLLLWDLQRQLPSRWVCISLTRWQGSAHRVLKVPGNYSGGQKNGRHKKFNFDLFCHWWILTFTLPVKTFLMFLKHWVF